MHFRLATVAACLAALPLTLTSPIKTRSPYAVKGSHPVPRGWSRIDRAPADHVVELRIGLNQGRFDELERQLYQVSDPRHHRYGQHLTSEEINELIKPSAQASNSVHEWLADAGISADSLSYTPAKDWIKVRLTVAEIEDLLDTEYHTFVSDDGLTAVRTPEWSLPLHLHDHISTIQPTNSFFGPRRRFDAEKRDSKAIMEPAIEASLPPTPDPATVEAVCNVSLVTPTCLRTLYGTIDYTVQSQDKNYMALNDFLGEVNLRSDARLLLQNYRPEAVSGADTFKQISINGGTVQQTPLNSTQLEAETGIEGDLDVQTMLGIAWPVPLTVYSTGGSPPYMPDDATTSDTNEPYMTWLDYILSLPDPLPSVISTSYDDDEQTVPYDYAHTVCNQLAQLGARGVSVLFAAGDDGVGSAGDCFTNDGKNTSTFLPEFPSTCPYVTSVGGTYKFEPEVAVFRNRSGAIYSGGGGFSNYFPRPAYQEPYVSNYVSEYVGSNYTGLYNPAGRGLPDISAQSLYFATYWNGSLARISGTSAATPAASSILALVNDALVAAGRPTLGFLNPWLYSGGHAAFNDILSGSNYGCDTLGFFTAPGWDAATGWGTPNFKDILALLNVPESSADNGGWGNWS